MHYKNGRRHAYRPSFPFPPWIFFLFTTPLSYKIIGCSESFSPLLVVCYFSRSSALFNWRTFCHYLQTKTSANDLTCKCNVNALWLLLEECWCRILAFMSHTNITVHHIHYRFCCFTPTGSTKESFDTGSTPLTTSKISIKQMGDCLFWFDTRPLSHLGWGFRAGGGLVKR